VFKQSVFKYSVFKHIKHLLFHAGTTEDLINSKSGRKSKSRRILQSIRSYLRKQDQIKSIQIQRRKVN